jgi:general secretion pathway protein G
MRPGKPTRNGRSRGFTLVELIVVVAIIGILVTVAMPIYKDSVRKAREAVLREDLWVMRDAIDQHFTDKGHYPSDLNALVDAGYLKQIPVDPITNASDTWVTEDAEADDSGSSDAPPGIKDVHSGAPGSTSDGKAYGEF